MTPEERTVGPPLAPTSSSLLNRLQRTQDHSQPSQVTAQAAPADLTQQAPFAQQAQGEGQAHFQNAAPEPASRHLPPVGQGAIGQPPLQSHSVVVTPFNSQVKGRNRGPAQATDITGKSS